MKPNVILATCVLLGGCAMADFTPYRGAEQNWPVATGGSLITSMQYQFSLVRQTDDTMYSVI